jgi:hypothetical protein
MRRFWTFLMSLMIVAALGVADLPRPCAGDGRGNGCSTTASSRCACVASCTCNLQHELDAYYASFPCCKMPQADKAAGGHKPLPNLSLPQKQWDAVAPTAPRIDLAAMPRGTLASTPWSVRRLTAPVLVGPEKPPRLVA